MKEKIISKKILIGREDVMEFAGLSKFLYPKFIKLGMPVLYIDGKVYAHADNIENFFKAITNVNAKNSPEAILAYEENEVEGGPGFAPQNGGSKKELKTQCGQKSCPK